MINSVIFGVKHRYLWEKHKEEVTYNNAWRHPKQCMASPKALLGVGKA